MEKNKYLIVIDGGATKYRVSLINLKTNIIESDYNEQNALTYYLTKENLKNLIKAIGQVYNRNCISLVVGLSGLDTQEEKKKANTFIKTLVTKFFKSIKDVYILNDLELMLSFSTNTKKVALVAGTGSNCIGVNNENIAKSGGMGSILSDQGSGFYIGSVALKYILKDFDGRGPKTQLTNAIKDYYKLNNITELKNIFNESNFNKRKIAEISKLVVICSLNNDLVSKKILQKSVKELSNHINAVVKKLNLAKEKFDLILIGGIMSIPQIEKGVLRDVAKYRIGKTINIKDKTTLAGLYYYKKAKKLI